METKANYIIVGLFVIGLSIVFVLALAWFSAGEHKEYDGYLVYVKESVSGLTPQAPVRFSGVDVGYVSDIRLNPKNPQQVELFLLIERGTPINQSTKALLMSQGITGITYVGLKAGAVDAPPLKILTGAKYPIINSEPSLLTQLDSVIREVTGYVKQITKSFQELLNEQNQKSIRDILINVEKFTETLGKNSDTVDASLKSAEKSLQYSEKITKTLSQQTAPEAVESMSRLSRILTDIEQLTNTLKQNPSILIRGTSPIPKGPGE